MLQPHQSLRQRLELYKVDADMMAAASKFWYAARPEFRVVLQRFYTHLSANPESARYLPGERGLERLRAAQTAHWGELFTGQFDAGFVSRVNNAAKAHIRIRLPNYHYMAAYAFFLKELILMAHRLFSDDDERSEVIGAITALVMIDADLTMSYYMQRLMRGDDADATNEAASA